jgi:tagaturonate reductase
MSRRIVQFGTSRFLQAHVDLFVHEARAAGQDIGPISVVKTTAGAERSSRLEAMRRPGGFPVRVRGFRDGTQVEDEIWVKSVDSALSAVDQWPAVVALFTGETEIAVSNVGDRGYDLADSDREHNRSSDRPPAGFPAKLLTLLLARFEATAAPLLFLPCELVVSNGEVLRRLVTELAALWRCSDAFMTWLANSVRFADTLVDRIVSEEIKPAGAIAEPYALWAIREDGFKIPFDHPAIVATKDLAPYERLKLYILNLGHTLLAEAWIRESRPAAENVRQILSEPRLFRFLTDVYAEEVVRGFAVHGMADVASRYVETTIERFRNPYLDHKMADIAQNHSAKIERRVRAFLMWVSQGDPSLPLPILRKLAADNSNGQIPPASGWRALA